MLRTIAALTLTGVAALTAITAHAAPPVRTQRVFADLALTRPVFLTHPHDGSDRIVIIEQAGRVLIFDNDVDISADDAAVAIDLTDKVQSPASGGDNEEGLLGLAFHPQFKSNGQVYLHYTGRGRRRNILAQFHLDAARGVIEPASEQVLMQVQQPWGNHNGGMIDFGPDGCLYIALGDGGGAGDPRGNGQNKGSLLGSILRIDVDHRDPGRLYAVPKDNPFAGQPRARGEIWACGLRNPWRFSFDRETGDLWAGDVGQEKWEEIDLIVKGGNYGWNIREGQHPFQTPTGRVPDDLIDPIVEHSHEEAKSITGGYVYRGDALPDLQGAYVYGDYVTGIIWALRYDNQTHTLVAHEQIGYVPAIASFGEDRDGELYVVSLPGEIFKFVKAR